jgi:predicted HTH domain antitoxin
MKSVQIQLPQDLVEAAQLDPADLSLDAARLLALELFREDKISMGKAAELCETPLESFIEFAGRREVPLHFGLNELEEDRRTLQKLFP